MQKALTVINKLVEVYAVPGAALRGSAVLTHLVVTAALRRDTVTIPQFIDSEIEARGDEVTWVSSAGVAEPGLAPRLPLSLPCPSAGTAGALSTPLSFSHLESGPPGALPRVRPTWLEAQRRLGWEGGFVLSSGLCNHF